MLSFDKGAELTYNPYYAMSLSLAPRWQFAGPGFVSARVSLTREITDSDVTTDFGEWWFSDTSIAIGAASFYTIPVVGLSFSGDLTITAPSSPVSRARTLQVGLGPGLSVRRSFDVLSGISLGYGFRGTWLGHAHTTAERELPLIPGCSGPACEEFVNTGVRNAEWRLVHAFDVGFGFTEWLSLAVSAALITDYLYPVTADERVSTVPQEPEDRRFGVSTNIALGFRPHRAVSVTLGASATNPQLAPDSSARTPFFNRYTTVYLDLSLDVAGLVDSIVSEEAEE